MKSHRLQQKGERRIAAVLRLALVALLLAAQVGFVILLSYYLRQNAGIVYFLLEIAALIAAVRLNNRRGDPQYKHSWIILILAVPVVGLILYLLWGGNSQRKRLARRGFVRHPADEPESVRMRAAMSADKLRSAYPAWMRTCNYLRARSFPIYQDTRTVYFPEGQLLLDDMIERISHAEHFVFLEYFILAEGAIWDRLHGVLLEKARSGVEVKIIFDDFGNIRRFSGETLDALRAAGIEVYVFNPVHEYVNRLYFNYRDHRKIACIDGNFAYTGGVNVADEYANLVNRFGYWKDSGVRLEGEGAWGLTSAFIEMWSFLGGEMNREMDYYRPSTRVLSDGFCQPFTDGPLNNPDNPAEDAYLQMIHNARRFLYITTPYFIPDESIMRALCVAGDGGVDVRLMLPGIPDHRYTDLVAESYFGELIEHGVRVYRYTPGFLHAKSVMVDREVAFIGSVNMDYRSFELHYECGVMLYGVSAIEDLLEDMDHIMEQCHELTLEEWKSRKWYKRLLEPLLRIFSIWM